MIKSYVINKIFSSSNFENVPTLTSPDCFQMLVTYANNSAVITEAITETNREHNQVLFI